MRLSETSCPIVTDSERKFLLGVATSQDLEVSPLTSAVILVYSSETPVEFCEEAWHILTYRRLPANKSLYIIALVTP